MKVRVGVGKDGKVHMVSNEEIKPGVKMASCGETIIKRDSSFNST